MSMTRRKILTENRKSGFSLIEMMIAVAILSIAVTFIYATFISQQNSALVQEDVSDVQQNARIVMDSLTRDVRGAGAGQIPGPQFVTTSNGIVTINNAISAYVTGSAMTFGSNVSVPVSSTRDFKPNDSVYFVQTSNYQFTTVGNISVPDATHIVYSGSTPPPQPGYLIVDAQPIVYRQSGNQVLRNNQPIADDIQSFTPQPISSTLVSLTLVAQSSKTVSNQGTVPRTRTFTSNIMVRQ